MASVRKPPKTRQSKTQTKTKAKSSPSSAEILTAVSITKILGDPGRLSLLFAIRDEPGDVGSLVEVTSSSWQVTTQRLARLRMGGLAGFARDGTHKRYEITEKGAVIAAILTRLGGIA